MSDHPVLVTGAAGFIGFCLARRLLEGGRAVVGIDSLNSYYDPALKEARLAILRQFKDFTFHRLDLADRTPTEALFRDGDFGPVVHLAAQAGVRYSLGNPHAYLDANLAGFLNVLEGCRHRRSGHLVFASSSSVYGANTRLPFSVHDNVDHPVSLYGATKKSNELMAHAYSHLYALPATGLRFFTVYGPWGRPDMAYYSFARAIVAGEPITLYEGGTLRRDFTYIDDIVAGVVGCLDRPPEGSLPARVLNIGNHRSEQVSTLVRLLEKALGKQAIVREAPRPPADVEETFASIDAIAGLTGFAPRTSLEEGIPHFVTWFKAWHGLDE
jgi:UDP-glucuronate 4-epimerase